MAKQPPEKTKPLLVDRRQAADILGVSGMTVRRIQADGKLAAVKLRDGIGSKTFYRKSDVYKIAGIPMPT